MEIYFVRRTEIFVVRLWAEYLTQSPPVWRGEIEHVGRGEVMRFGSLREMNDLIRRCISMRPCTERRKNDE